MKVKENHVRDFSAYLRWRRRSSFNPSPFPLLQKGNDSTLFCYVELDSTGKLKRKPRHPRALKAVMEGKRNLNLQIRSWAEGFYDCGGLCFLEELKVEFAWFPSWVWEALQKQARKRVHARIF